MAVNCDRFENVQEVFIPFFILWCVVLGGWCYNTYVKNQASANSLHRMLTWLPAVECLYTFLCIFYYGSCPWTSFGSQLVAAALLMVVILKEPLNLLCLLLVAKGWCITRETLHHGENRVIVVTVVLLYASVVFQLFGTTIYWMIPILIAYIVMLFNVVFSIYTNLRVLKSQLLAMSHLSIDPLSTPAYAKYVMFKRLAVATAAYVVMELVIHISTTVVRSARNKLYVFLLCHQLMELICVLYIGITFRARPFNNVFQHMQEFSLQLAEQLLPTVTTVSINTLELSGPGMVEWNEKMNEPPEVSTTIIVVNPGGDDPTIEGHAGTVQTAVCTAYNGITLSSTEQAHQAGEPLPPPGAAPAEQELAPVPPTPPPADADTAMDQQQHTRFDGSPPAPPPALPL